MMGLTTSTFRPAGRQPAFSAARCALLRALRFPCGAVVCVMLTVAGCSPADIDRTYGRRRGAEGGESVNGTAVLAEMYRRAGHRVLTWRRLSPKLREADAIVWAPDSFQPPPLEQREWFESWISGGGNRTLIYIGRDYDAAIDYWSQVQAETAPAEQAVEVARRLAEAQADYASRRARMPADESAEWFHVRRDSPRRTVDELQGLWSSGVDASQVQIQLASRLETPSDASLERWIERDELPARPRYESLLTSGDDTLVLSMQLPQWGSSRMLFVVNGSFLLNFPLINHEHRKLAAKLVAASGEPGRVIFLESGPDGPLILDDDPDADYPTGLEMFTVWPLGVIVMHLAALGMTLAIACYPIFGRARSWQVASASDFGQHVTAVGEMLQKTGDSVYALGRLKYYHDHIRRESGVSHRSESPKSPLRGT